MRYTDFTPEKKQVFREMLEEKLEWWVKNCQLKIEWNDDMVSLMSENTMHGSIVADASELKNAFGLTSHITCRMMNIVMDIF